MIPSGRGDDNVVAQRLAGISEISREIPVGVTDITEGIDLDGDALIDFTHVGRERQDLLQLVRFDDSVSGVSDTSLIFYMLIQFAQALFTLIPAILPATRSLAKRLLVFDGRCAPSLAWLCSCD